MLASPPYRFELTFPGQNGLRALPVRVFDYSGTVRGVELPTVAPMGLGNAEGDTFAAAVPGRPDAVYVAWLGGMCDEQVQLEYTGGDRTFTVTTVRGQGGCRLAGITRGVIVQFSSPVDVAGFNVQDMS